VSLVFEERPAAAEPVGALVLLHGRGADQYDLLPVLDALDPERRLAAFTPRGPLSLPPGGAHWYRLGGIPTPDPETFSASFEQLAAWLDGLPVPWERTVIGGFSQGTVMAYALGLGAGRPSPAGILALSGFLPDVPGFELDLESRAGLPVTIAHGTLDQVIPVQFGRAAAQLLSDAGLDVSYRESPVGHGVDPGAVGELRDWLLDRVP
jgi:phospholipase/carboxylesterase